MPSKKSAQEILEESSKLTPEFKKEKIKLSISKKDIPEQEAVDEIKKEEKPKKKTKPKKEISKKLKKFLSKLIDKEDKNFIKTFISYSCLYGLLVNFSLFVVTSGFIRFNYYSWIGWGIILWFLDNKLISLIRRTLGK